jgi:hypothetical protein
LRNPTIPTILPPHQGPLRGSLQERPPGRIFSDARKDREPTAVRIFDNFFFTKYLNIKRSFLKNLKVDGKIHNFFLKFRKKHLSMD